MKNLRLLSSVAPVAALLAYFALVQTVRAAVEEEVVEKTFQVGEAPEVGIESFNGSITIHGNSKNEVRVKCTKYVQSITGIGDRATLDQITVELKQDGNTLSLVARKPSGISFMKSAGARFEVDLPAASLIKAHTTNGKVMSEKTTGNSNLETTNGSIRIEDATGDITAETTNGPIEAEFKSKKVSARTTNGTIVLKGVAEEIKGHTTNGSIRIETGDRPAHVLASTTNGAIRFGGALAGKNEFETTNGSVSLGLPSHSAFEIDASTSNGRITNDFQMSKVEVSRKRQLVARRGDDPQASIRVRTSNSSIKIAQN